MKKFVYGCLIVLFAVLASTAASVTLISCDKGPVSLKPAVGVKEVSNCLDSIVNPRLSTTKDVFELQNKLVVNSYVDSVFMCMNQTVLQNVASVVLKQRHVVTKDDIVQEYIKNRSVYENLPAAAPTPDPETMKSTTTTKTPIPGVVHEETTTVTEAPPTRVGEQPAGYKDTTINGKHALISM